MQGMVKFSFCCVDLEEIIQVKAEMFSSPHTYMLQGHYLWTDTYKCRTGH